MRLGTCLAVEAALGIAAVCGAALGTFYGVDRARHTWDAWESSAHAATYPAVSNALVAPDGSKAAIAVRPVAQPGDLRVAPPTDVPHFHGVPDELLLEPLRTGNIERIKFNRGGSSISLRIDFDNGSRAAFKPMQTNPQSVPRKEIAAYRINLLLGLHAVQPAIGRSFRVEELYSFIDGTSAFVIPRLDAELTVDDDGWVHGELSWWIPVIRQAEVDGYDIDTTDGIVTWKRYLSADTVIPGSAYHMVRQISSMVLFDFIINNPDRWTGANARSSEDGEWLYFMDNTLSFDPKGTGHRKARTYFQRSQTFSRRLVLRLRTLTEQDVRAAVSYDKGPFEYLLSEEEIRGVIARRDFALDYIDGLIEQYGEDAVLAFP